jgi:hypothetical protein
MIIHKSAALITLEHPLKLDGNVCEQEFQNYGTPRPKSDQGPAGATDYHAASHASDNTETDAATESVRLAQ